MSRPHQDRDGALHRRELLQFAHDLRNLILPILASAELLLESQELSPQQQGRIQTILQQVNRVQTLVEDVLWLGHDSPTHQPVDILSAVNQVVERIRAATKVPVQCLFVSEEPLYVAGSEARLWRAFYNLVLNAAEAAGESGHVLVRVLTNVDSDRVRIEVEDSGPGLSRDLQAKMFSPFFTTKASHAGLGLSLAKEVIESYGGTISLASERNRGTTFRVQLPLLSTRIPLAPQRTG